MDTPAQNPPPAVESMELRRLKGLLRSGFRITRVHVRSNGDVATAPQFEIVTTRDGSTANFTYADKDVQPTDTPGEWRMSLPATTNVEVELHKKTSVQVLSSVQDDFKEFAQTMHPSLDAKGDVTLRPFANNDAFWRESRELALRMVNRQAEFERLRTSSAKVDLDEHKKLLIELLRTKDWGGRRFLPLKEHFIELEVALLIESKRLLEIQNSLYAKNPMAKRYAELVEELLNAAVWYHNESFVKRAIRFFELVAFDVRDAILRAVRQRQQVDDLLGMLAKRSPMPGREGIPYLMDANRRYCESLRPFVDALSDAVAKVEKWQPFSPNTGYKKRVEAIRKTRFAGIVLCLDPDIRHSESHDGTDYDDDTARVLLTEVGEDGVRRKLGEYTYWQISDMTLELQNGLFLAVINAFALHEVGVLSASVVSREYFNILTSIGNLAD